MPSNRPTLCGRIAGVLRSLAHWRCREPVLVFESDDWGMERRPAPQFLSALGDLREWATESTETPADLAALYDILGMFRDGAGRSACFTPNFIVANPDYDAIRACSYRQYHETPIDQDSLLADSWMQGLERHVFYPQYHGRSHLWPARWLKDLVEDVPGTRRLVEERVPGGRELLKAEGWRYHSEYVDWETGEALSGPELFSWMDGGLRYFERLFGFRPHTMIAPHYILTPAAASAWAQAGGTGVQGAGYRLLWQNGGAPVVIRHLNGEYLPEGPVCTVRTVKFDPRPERPRHGAASAVTQVLGCFRDHLPAVVDTHRINFTGRYAQEGAAGLRQLLEGVKEWKPRFLASSELAEAVRRQGHYTDVWTGEARRLTPMDGPGRRFLRRIFAQVNRRQIRRVEAACAGF